MIRQSPEQADIFLLAFHQEAAPDPAPGIQNPGLLEPAGLTDPEVSVLALRTADDRPLALFANYSLHYVGDMPPLSADYFGVFGDRIGGLLGAKEPGFVGILSNGTSGDVNNVNFGGPPPPKREVGERSRLVAEAIGQAAKKAADTNYRSDITLAVAEKELEFRVRKPSAVELKRAQELLEKANGRELKGVEEIYARETMLIAKYPDTVKLKVQAIRIGDLGIVAIPCGDQEAEPVEADVHGVAGERLQRLPTDAGAARTRRLRNLASAIELP